jgi:beta-lactam-binding protein with PASTA domain
VPRVLGLSLSKAKTRILKANCKTGKLVRRASTLKQKGRVIAQRPKPGTRLKNGGKVNLTLGKGA